MRKLVFAAILAGLAVSGSGCLLVPIDGTRGGYYHDGYYHHHGMRDGPRGGDSGPHRDGPDRHHDD